MAVTERFREIGTMKCLGALDRFILRLFLLEASMQGLAGAGMGALAGRRVCAPERTPFVSGPWPSPHRPLVGGILFLCRPATGVGCLLSCLGVLYPAIVAARMQPVEAMRSEH